MVNETSGEITEDINLKEKIQSWNFSQLAIPMNFLEYGLYKCEYFFELHASPVYALKRTDFTYFRIGKVNIGWIIWFSYQWLTYFIFRALYVLL